jgi:hypothetical protein
MSQADQRPFGARYFNAPQQELAEAAPPIDLPENRLDECICAQAG